LPVDVNENLGAELSQDLRKLGSKKEKTEVKISTTALLRCLKYETDVELLLNEI